MKLSHDAFYSHLHRYLIKPRKLMKRTLYYASYRNALYVYRADADLNANLLGNK